MGCNGKVEFFRANTQGGYGFIQPSDNSERVYLARKHVVSKCTPQKDDVVEYDLCWNSNPPSALKVRVKPPPIVPSSTGSKSLSHLGHSESSALKKEAEKKSSQSEPTPPWRLPQTNERPPTGRSPLPWRKAGLPNRGGAPSLRTSRSRSRRDDRDSDGATKWAPIARHHDAPKEAPQDVCTFYLEGTCKYGSACWKEHPFAPSRQPCFFFRQGSCRYGAACHDEHVVEAARVSFSSMVNELKLNQRAKDAFNSMVNELKLNQRAKDVLARCADAQKLTQIVREAFHKFRRKQLRNASAYIIKSVNLATAGEASSSNGQEDQDGVARPKPSSTLWNDDATLLAAFDEEPDEENEGESEGEPILPAMAAESLDSHEKDEIDSEAFALFLQDRIPDADSGGQPPPGEGPASQTDHLQQQPSASSRNNLPDEDAPVDREETDSSDPELTRLARELGQKLKSASIGIKVVPSGEAKEIEFLEGLGFTDALSVARMRMALHLLRGRPGLARLVMGARLGR
ncbi:unnamed protein product [Polarella glacialis]|uniref:C3H1-type domain-containing protein n=1 Tax=Polarella glacialis TaxID=89957 RepID=A0A813JR67_POLGL|nr:unnamed protein product [Polarella glacialis]